MIPMKHGALVVMQKAIDNDIGAIDRLYMELIQESRAFYNYGYALRRQKKSTRVYLRWRRFGGEAEYIDIESALIRDSVLSMPSHKREQLVSLEQRRIENEATRQFLAVKRDRLAVHRKHLKRLKEFESFISTLT